MNENIFQKERQLVCFLKTIGKKIKVPPVHFQRLKNFKNLQHRLDVVQQILKKSFVLTRAKIALFIFQRGQFKICSSINLKIFEKRVAFV